ncbi:MAG: glutaredoxin family protein [Saprospiraceae bacterium]|nr:glutaredoxin family protein [Saprospiraceae bacterium]
MKRLFVLLTLFIVAISLSGQNIVLKAKSLEEEVVVIATNNEADDYDVTIILDTKGFGLKRNHTVTKRIEANETTEVGRFQKKRKRKASFKYSYTLKKIFSETKGSENNNLHPVKGLTVYTKNGCGRCTKTISFLEANNIIFTEKNTTTDKQHDKELSTVLFGNGFKGGSFTTPVIVLDGDVHYSIKNLGSFLEKLKSGETKKE